VDVNEVDNFVWNEVRIVPDSDLWRFVSTIIKDERTAFNAESPKRNVFFSMVNQKRSTNLKMEVKEDYRLVIEFFDEDTSSLTLHRKVTDAV